jgi:hypothetical protein
MMAVDDSPREATARSDHNTQPELYEDLSHGITIRSLLKCGLGFGIAGVRAQHVAVHLG